MKALKAGGAEAFVCASNPLSTQDDVAASLVVDEEIGVFAINGEDTETYYKHIDATLDLQPTITMDDGADLVSRLHSEETNPALVEQVVAGTEETTTGVIRLKSMAAEALEAVMDGFRVMPMQKAVQEAGLVVTLTGDIHVLRKEHFEAMKDGAIIANSGHFNVEIDIPALEKLSVDKRSARPYVDAYTLEDGKKLYLIGEGRLVNLAAAEGHPASVMDMSFANQALSLEYIAKNRDQLENRVYDVPESIDDAIALLKLQAFGIEIDTLTAEQEKISQLMGNGNLASFLGTVSYTAVH
ncbi:Adenosylhomocysteinase, partial [Geodia barretti]